MVGMGRIGQAIARRLEASRVPVVYHSRKPADGVSYKHYPRPDRDGEGGRHAGP